MAETNAPHSKTLDIRKYPNRRYYDVTRSQHLTLEDIRELVREGHDIRVTDSKTSADITPKVLAQI
ncbi:MAG TPA: polyhydroxyalkanoate synthesis regulator DNA-binding domain-containing protein, partial [Verrucomicrobiae bacterium]|nr:polyhydroxyalkanoate synthesis regulator DNA-binding domain-containing protein [Verrucomicrobiae bacterium]